MIPKCIYIQDANTPSFFAWTCGGIMQIFPHHDVDMWGRIEWAVLRGVAES